MKPTILLLACVVAWTMQRNAHAGFVNGLESFDGSTFDSATWDPPLTDTGSVVSQSNAIIFQGTQFAIGRYNSKTLTIGVGESVSAEVMISAPVSLGTNVTVSASLALTTKDNALQQGPVTEDLFDTLALSVALGRLPSNLETGRISARIQQSGGGTGLLIADNVPLLDTLYKFQIERLSTTTARFTAGLADGPVFLAVERTHPAADELYISLQGINGRVRIDNVQIVPEPATYVMAAMGVVALLFARRRS